MKHTTKHIDFFHNILATSWHSLFGIYKPEENGKTKFPMLPPLLAVFEKRGHYHEETNFKEAYLRDNLPS